VTDVPSGDRQNRSEKGGGTQTPHSQKAGGVLSEHVRKAGEHKCKSTGLKTKCKNIKPPISEPEGFRKANSMRIATRMVRNQIIIGPNAGRREPAGGIRVKIEKMKRGWGAPRSTTT